MEVIVTKNDRQRIAKVKKAISSAENFIGSVTFKKRSDDEIRRIAYRIHCQHPTFAPTPNGRGDAKGRGTGHRKAVDKKNQQMTVLDVNQPLYNRKGHIIGRGAWKTIPLENVRRVRAGGTIYKFVM